MAVVAAGDGLACDAPGCGSSMSHVFCAGVLSGGDHRPHDDHDHAAAYIAGQAWSAGQTASPDDGPVMGNTLTWSIAPDGTPIDAQQVSRGEVDGPSDLIASLDALYGGGPGGSDLKQRPWFATFESAIERWDELSGLTLTYEPSDDGAAIEPFGAAGQIGVRGDIRLSGHPIDGIVRPTVLAYNFFPRTGGDMVIDTEQADFLAPSANDSLVLRNIVSHEVGHGLGLHHESLPQANGLMEASVSTAFDGPQFDDILGVHSLYGDRFDAGPGNHLPENATDLGTLTPGDSFAIGTHASDEFVVTPDLWDFVSASSADSDGYRFELAEAGWFSVSATPRGPEYLTGAEDSPVVFDAAVQADLFLFLDDVISGERLAFVNETGLGQAEAILDVWLDPGVYSATVFGAGSTQMYELQLGLVPEPGVAAMLVVGLAAAGWRRR